MWEAVRRATERRRSARARRCGQGARRFSASARLRRLRATARPRRTRNRLRPMLGSAAAAAVAEVRSLRSSDLRGRRAAGASSCRRTFAPRAASAGPQARSASASCTRSSTTAGIASRARWRRAWRGSTGRRTSWRNAPRWCPCRCRRSASGERGYNQTLHLARELGTAMVAAGVGRRCSTRTRHTETQTRLTPGDRLRNVSGAFSARSSARNALRGAHVVVVDDVVTTAATLNACAAALCDGGARIVSFVTFGRAPALGDRW